MRRIATGTLITNRVARELGPRGTIIGPHDLWLAATCIAHDLTMVTGNLRELERVDGLTVECWTDNR